MKSTSAMQFMNLLGILHTVQLSIAGTFTNTVEPIYDKINGAQK